MNPWQTMLEQIDSEQNCVLVSVIATKGSAPRDNDAQMVVTNDGLKYGTIGGGALEWQAITQAQTLLAEHHNYLRREMEQILGPDLEQCCGGVVKLSFELFTMAERKTILSKTQVADEDQNIVLYGAGHVGKALVQMLCLQDVKIQWVDEREEIFPTTSSPNVICHQTLDLLQQRENTFVLIMTHDHKLDFELTKTALQSPQVAFTGLIGSATKKARFVRRLSDVGLFLDQISKLVCPIGIDKISAKSPAAIAASVTAQVLIEMELVKTAENLSNSAKIALN